jgi:hypothetical protein
MFDDKTKRFFKGNFITGGEKLVYAIFRGIKVIS